MLLGLGTGDGAIDNNNNDSDDDDKVGATSPSPSKCRAENNFNNAEVMLPALVSKCTDPDVEEGKVVSVSALPS